MITPDAPHLRASSTSDWAGRKVRLREVTPSDRTALSRFDRDVTSRHAPLVGGYRHWAAHRASTTDEDLQLVVETVRSGLLVGSLSTVRTDSSPGCFSYGIGIAPWHWRCGYAADAITVLLALMFGRRGYRECEVSIHGNNFASQSLHARLGFRETGRLHDPGLSPGSFRYLVMMSVSAAEFATRHPGFALPVPADRSRRGVHWRRLRGRHWRSTTR
jgi:RimJ/RimL family protein N-acetyltransferase